MRSTEYLTLAKAAASKWSEDNAARLGAAIAFYSMLSLGPLFLLFISGAALIYGQEAAQGHLLHQIDSLVGSDGAKAIQDMLANSDKGNKGIWASLAGIIMLLVGASGVFGELVNAMNQIWQVPKPVHTNILTYIKQRFFSFSMVLGAGFLLLVSLIISSVLSAVNLGDADGLHVPLFVHALNALISFAITMGLFACIFKYIPSTHIQWRNVWVGAALTTLLFTLGKFLIGIYLGHSALSSAYGAGGSLVVMLVWIYYSAQILYFGAELTYVITQHKAGKPVS